MIRVASAQELEKLWIKPLLPIWRSYQRQASIQKLARKMVLARGRSIRIGPITVNLTSLAEKIYQEKIEDGMDALEIGKDEAMKERQALLGRGIQRLLQTKAILLQELAVHNRMRKFLNKEMQDKYQQATSKRLFLQIYKTGPDGLPLLDRTGNPIVERQTLLHYDPTRPNLLKEAAKAAAVNFFIPWIQTVDARRQPLLQRLQDLEEKIALAKGSLKKVQNNVAAQYVDNPELLQWAKVWTLFLESLIRNVGRKTKITKITPTLFRFKKEGHPMRVFFKRKGPQVCVAGILSRGSTTYSDTVIQALDRRCSGF